MRFSEGVADGVLSLDEHWNGGGKPLGISGEDIPLYSRIALLSQVADIFQMSAGREAAIAEIGKRADSWFDPSLCAAFAPRCRPRRFLGDACLGPAGDHRSRKRAGPAGDHGRRRLSR
jgi:response regulator RpfG family c-di-GMP phosphodiesterase